jgi:uncharacterized protein with gpF-like domain
MISTNIDGSIPGSNALADVLAMIANPTAYAAKLAELQAATDEYKAFVALIGPASEIEKLRSDASLDRENAAAATAFAKNFAATTTAEAKAEAADIVAKAKDKAADIIADTKAMNAEAKKLKASLTEAIENANALMANAEVKTSEAEAKVAFANAVAEELAKAQADLTAEKKAIADRHKQFLESL